MITCAELARARDGRRAIVAGLVLVRQKPGSAKGVMFLTIEDESGVANLIVWPSVFERQRRVILGAGMIACHGRVQREGAVIHVVTDWLEDLSALLRQIGRDAPPVQGEPEPHEAAITGPSRDIYIPDLRLGSGIKVPTRDFR
jgi:error-prone DNA polymerase